MITNAIIDAFLDCKLKAYLRVTNQAGTKTPNELQEDTLRTSMRSEFYAAHQHQAIDARHFKRLRLTELQPSDRRFVFNLPIVSPEYDLTIDAVEVSIAPPTRKDFLYTPINISPKQRVFHYDRVRLCIAAIILQDVHGELGLNHGTIIFGHSFSVSRFSLQSHRTEARRILKEIKQLNSELREPRCYWNRHCTLCEYQTRCRAELLAKDDLSLLANIKRKEIDRFNNRGIFTVNQLSYTFRPPKQKKAPDNWRRSEHSLKALALREKRTYILKAPSFPDCATEIYIDFEGLPDEGFIYLIGMSVFSGTSNRHYSFWADSRDDADGLIEQLLKALAAFENCPIYHYGAFESRVLKNYRSRANEPSAKDIDRILQTAVNILPMFASHVYPPTHTNQLKEIATFLGFQWTDTQLFGPGSIARGRKWEADGDVAHKDALIRYNTEDCLALKTVKHWLTSLNT